MADYKKQHIVPRRYLKSFSADGRVWFFDGNKQIHVPYESQNQSNYYYSKSLAQEVEKILEDGERLFFGRLDNVESVARHELETAILVFLLLDFNFRSSKHANNTSLERYDAIKGITYSYVIQFIMGQKERNQSLNELHYYLSCLYRMCLLKIPDEIGDCFITSDCPSVIAGVENSLFPCFLFIPISPKRALFLSDKTRYHFVESSVWLKEIEINKLNLITCVNANRRIYSINKISNSHLETFRAGLLSFQGSGEIFRNENGVLQFKDSKLALSREVLSEFRFLKKNTNDFDIIPYSEAQEIYQSGAVTIDHENKRLILNKSLSLQQLYCATRAGEIDSRMRGLNATQAGGT
jgi:hypothetical protein